MLDKQTSKVLEIINQLCDDGSYKVLEVAAILAKQPHSHKASEEGVKDLLNYLIEREYISCKFKDDKSYCIMPLPKGKLYSEKQAEEKKEKRSYLMIVLLSIAGSVIGGFIGAFIANLFF